MSATQTPEWRSAGNAWGGAEVLDAKAGTEDAKLEEVVEYVLSDCFFAVGQTLGMRTTVDYDAVVWWHDHFPDEVLGGDASSG